MTGVEPAAGAGLTINPNLAVPPRLSERSAALGLALGVAASGVVVGALWAWLAPPVSGVVALSLAGERVRGFVGEEADHIFVAAFLMVGFLAVSGIVSAVAAWTVRAHRGPVMVAALTVGNVAAAAIATGVGALLARLRYGTVDVAGAPVSPEHRVHYVVEAPGVFLGHSAWQIAVTLLFPAGLAALAYAIGALSTARDDLGAWTGVPATGPGPTAAVYPPVDPSAPSH